MEFAIGLLTGIFLGGTLMILISVCSVSGKDPPGQSATENSDDNIRNIGC